MDFDILEAGTSYLLRNQGRPSLQIRCEKIEDQAEQRTAMGDLHPARPGSPGNLGDLVEALFWQVPLTDQGTGRGGASEKIGILKANRPRHQRPQHAEFLDLGTVVACGRQLQCIDRNPAICLKADQKQRRQRASEILDHRAFALREKHRVIVEGDRVAGALGSHGQTPDA